MFIYQRPSKSIFIPKETTYLLPRNHITDTLQNGLFEEPLIEWTKQFCYKDKIMIDIGAHTGTYSLSLAPFVREVQAFEPQRLTYYGLCGGVALSNFSNIHCHSLGLGSIEQVGSQTLNIVSEDGGGSTLLDHQFVKRRETIIVQTLDSFQFQNICLIKIDVEGNEANVIKGALQTLQRNDYPYIIFEANDDSTLKSVKDILIEHTPYQIHPIRGVYNMFLASK